MYHNILGAFQGSFASQSWFQTQGQGHQLKANYPGLKFNFCWLTRGFIKYLISIINEDVKKNRAQITAMFKPYI